MLTEISIIFLFTTLGQPENVPINTNVPEDIRDNLSRLSIDVTVKSPLRPLKKRPYARRAQVDSSGENVGGAMDAAIDLSVQRIQTGFVPT